ncbi:MAG: flagellar hook-associated protein FlgL [Planctomycetota bacterium]|jgi:flagellar hook-associated protein 3 FlgL
MAQTLSNIYSNVGFALNLHTDALVRLQEQVSTGMRVNRASDDPSSAYQILGYDSQVRSLDTYTEEISSVISGLEFSHTAIENMIGEIVDTRTNISQIVSGTYGESGRERIANGINDTLEQLVLLANSKHIDQYVFGGATTSSAPYTVSRTNGKISSVSYQGSREQLNIEVAPGVQSSSFYIGEDVFRSSERSDPVFSGLTGAANGTGTSSVTGDAWLTVIHDGSNYKVSIDDGASYVTVPGGGSANQAVTNSVTGKILYVDTTGINSTGVEIVRVPGTYDVFSTLITVRDILENDRTLSDDQLHDLLEKTMIPLNEMNDLLVQSQVKIGSRIGFLDDMRESLKELKYDAENGKAQLEDADIAQVAIDLSRREVLYQMSLSVAARIMSMSLLDFI